MTMKPAAAFALALVAGTGVIAIAAASSRKKVGAGELAYDPPRPTGALEIRDGRVVVRDWNLWMKSTPDTIRRIVGAGETRPDVVTAAIMRAALPDQQWPPAEDSPFAGQWLELTRTVAEMLHLNNPPPPGLRLVK